jgi:protein-tyrosine phosphatase
MPSTARASQKGIIMRVLTVCLGNICRSPAAEAVLRALAPDWTIDSAGTSDWHIGDPPYAPMQAAGAKRGYDLASLRARQFTAEDFNAFDLILVMDEKNLEKVLALRPSGSETPVKRLTDFGGTEADHVPDPYCTRDFEGALDLIETCSRALVDQLAQ